MSESSGSSTGLIAAGYIVVSPIFGEAELVHIKSERLLKIGNFKRHMIKSHS
jgi:hypothetical protein